MRQVSSAREVQQRKQREEERALEKEKQEKLLKEKREKEEQKRRDKAEQNAKEVSFSFRGVIEGAITLYWWCLFSCEVVHLTALLFFYHILQCY